MSESNDNIVPLYAVGKADPGSCTHMRSQLVINKETELVQCARCGTWLSPFKALRLIVQQWDWHQASIRRSRADAERAHASLVELKRQEANTKARLKRAQRKLSELGDCDD